MQNARTLPFGKALALKVDIAKEREVVAAVEGAQRAFGRLDILVNNAAIDFTVPIDELTLEEWDAVIRVNLRAPFLFSQLAARIMKRR